MMGSQDDVILAPSTTVLYRLSGSQYLRMIVASAVSEEQMAAAQDEIAQILRGSHRIQPGEDDDFSMRTQTEIIDIATGITETLTLLLRCYRRCFAGGWRHRDYEYHARLCNRAHP